MNEYFCSSIGDKVLYYYDVIKVDVLSNTNNNVIKGLLHCSNTMCDSEVCPLLSKCPEQMTNNQ